MQVREALPYLRSYPKAARERATNRDGFRSVFFQVATNQDPFPTNCTFSSLTAFNIPDVPFTACTDSDYIWSFRAVKAGDGTAAFYELALADAAESLVASKFFSAADFPVLTSGAAVYQQYTGPTRFVVE